MKSLFDWLDDRTGVRGFLHDALFERVPGGARWRYVWGSTLSFAFFVQLVTGLFLWMCYSPSAQTAWESVYYIQNEMQGGWLLRGLHHFMAHAMVVLMVLHLMQVVIDGAYRAPREVNFWLGLVLDAACAGAVADGLSAAVGSKGLLGHARGHQLAERRAAGRSATAALLVVGGADYGHHDTDPIFRAARRRVCPAYWSAFLVRARGAVSPQRHLCHRLPAKGPRRDVLARPGAERRRGVPGRAGRGPTIDGASAANFFSSDEGNDRSRCVWGPSWELRPIPRISTPRRGPSGIFCSCFSFSSCSRAGENAESCWAPIVIPAIVALLALFLMPLVGRWKLGHRFNIGLLAAPC